MRLRDRRAFELLLPIVVVALRAGEIELALPAIEHGAAGLEERPRALIDRGIDRHAARLPSHIGVEREQLLALEWQRRRLLAFGAADVDLLIEIDRATACRIEGRIAGGDALHGFARLAMAVGAGFVRRAGLALP